MPSPFWESEKDLSDEEQERIKVNEDFEASNPDGAAASIPAAEDIEFNSELEETLEERAEAIQTVGNDESVPDRFEDDVYQSQERAERAVFASALRGMGAATSTKGVESPVRWGIARVDDFAKTIKSGEPDDAEFVSDNDLLPAGHPLRSVDDPPDGLDDQPFVTGVPEGDQRDMLGDLARDLRGGRDG
jgi:hypothetical protein